MAREKVSLTGSQETLLITLSGRAMDNRSPRSILHDEESDEALRSIDYDTARLTRIGRAGARQIAARAKEFDRWVARFLDARPECVVLHLGCGLDTRGHRLDPPPTVRWYDVDLPDVIELRRRLYPTSEGQHDIAASATDPHLLDEIPGDRPVLLVAEGLTPYLGTADGIAMLRRVVDHFPGGEMLFDGYNRLGVAWLRLALRIGPYKASGAHVEWAIDDPRDLERAVPGLVFDSEWPIPGETELRRHYGSVSRAVTHAFGRTPLRRMGRGLRYHFGP